MSDTLIVERDGPVAIVRLNRPQTVNALTSELFAALVAAAQGLSADPSVRAVVLCGSGRGFCGGLDTSGFAGQAEGGDLLPSTTDGPADRADLGVPGLRLGRGQKAVWAFRLVPVPVIVALHGAAVGGGLQLALGGDIRIAAPDARLGLLEVRWGFVPDMGATQLLPPLIGLDRTRDLIYSGRVLSGDEAHTIGLVTHLAADPIAAATEYAAAVASRNPHAIRQAKALTALAETITNEALVDERRAMRATIGSPNQIEAVRAALGERQPTFADPDAETPLIPPIDP